MNSSRLARCALSPLLVVLWLGGCSPTLQIVSYQPGRIEPRGARALVLLEGEGLKEARVLAAQLVDGEASGTWWRVENRSDEGPRLVKANARAEIVGETRGLRRDELWARVDVVEWDLDNITVEEENEDGEVVPVPAVKAEVMLQAILADASGKILLDEQQYRGTVVVAEGAGGPSDPLLEAARVAVSSLLDDISPQRRTDFIRLDDSDSGQKAVIQRIVKAQIPLRDGERGLRRYLKKNPGNGVALYNLAVVLDAQGKHDEALTHYDESMQIAPRDYYRETRAGCARRAAARKAVYGETTSPPPQKAAPSAPGIAPPAPTAPPAS